ncbi:hypothetical protein MY11210_007446 [Beauveria gryllotalpidicola]
MKFAVASTKERMNDIGIIKLATPIEKSDDIEYAPLPTSDAVPDGSEELVALGCYLDFINENLGQRGFTDGDNQRIKDEAKKAAMLKACKKQHSDKYYLCMKEARVAYTSSDGTEDPGIDKLGAYYDDIAKCDDIKAMESACDGSVGEANVDSTAETVIQCSEAGKKGN